MVTKKLNAGRITLYLCGWSCLLALGGCASIFGFEDGKTLGKGNQEIGLALNYVITPDLLDDGLDDDARLATFAMAYKKGVTQDLDMGIRMSTSFNANLFAKYHIYGDAGSTTNLALGMEMGTILFWVYELHFPVYLSYHPTDRMALYFTPRFVRQFGLEAGRSRYNYGGANFGLLFGKKKKLGLDMGLFSIADGKKRKPYFNLGVGGRFEF